MLAAVLVMAATLLSGCAGLAKLQELELKEIWFGKDEGEENNGQSWFSNKETIYFWYSDETLTDINSAAVAFGEREGVRILPVLNSESEYLEAINEATLHTGQAPDAYLLSNDLLEKA